MLLFLAPFAVGSLLIAASDPRTHLEALKARKADEEKAVQVLSAREGSVLDALSEADRAYTEALAEAQRAELDRAESEKLLLAARERERAAHSRLDALGPELVQRLAAGARLGRLGELVLLLSSHSLSDLAKRSHLLGRIRTHDLAVLEESRRAAGDGEWARRAQQAETSRLAVLAAEAEKKRTEAAGLREEHLVLLGAVQSARTLHERTAGELSAQEQKLGEFVAALPSRASSFRHAGFGELRGKLPHPTTGPIEVGFGRIVNPRFNTVTVQKGIDVRAPLGAPVHAVAPGRVVHAGWFKGYGNLVIVDHGDGYHTLVAHLHSMRTAMGEEVEAGALIGTVGESGSLKGPYLYFEIRERGRSVDPSQWLAP